MLDTIIHWGLIAYLIVAPTVAVFTFRQPALAFALIVAGATALIFTRLPDISSLKLLGLQATLERQIGKVQVTIEELYGSPEISGHECLLSQAAVAGRSYRAGDAGAQATAQSERIRRWLVANRFQAVSQASMISGRLANTELASQWLRR